MERRGSGGGLQDVEEEISELLKNVDLFPVQPVRYVSICLNKQNIQVLFIYLFILFILFIFFFFSPFSPPGQKLFRKNDFYHQL